MNFKTRGRQAKPTKAEVAAAWEHIRVAAEAGNLQACALLIALTEGKPFMHTDGGIINLPGVSSGWRGEENDLYESILEKIRENDPHSKQLPENQ